jgi:mitogen-activated protein kinase 7
VSPSSFLIDRRAISISISSDSRPAQPRSLAGAPRRPRRRRSIANNNNSTAPAPAPAPAPAAAASTTAAAAMSDLANRKVFKVFNQEFVVDERYNVTKELGQGAYGIVCAATNNQTGEGVAIKKVTNVFSKKILAKRALREIKLLQHFRGHRNITCLYDMDIPRPDNFNECYLYEELMECDLAAIIRSGQPLTDAHFQSFIYQILCGLKYIHSANVLHRDLKPGNLLVNADCELKICDFGLARGFSMDPEENAGYMTEYVATRWYRAPEIMLSFQSYTKAIDVWSVGCILAELLGGKPFFKGRDYVDQLNQILHYLGTPNEETLSRIGSPRAQDYVRNLPRMQKISFQSLFRNANPDALDLLDRLLAFDPSSRISVEEALEHRYLQIWHDASDEPSCPTTFDFQFEVVDEIPDMKRMILDEVNRFRQMVRVQPGAGGAGQQGAGQQVPIPNNYDRAGYEDPRPQEAFNQQAGQWNDLERDLQGLDGRLR